MPFQGGGCPQKNSGHALVTPHPLISDIKTLCTTPADVHVVALLEGPHYCAIKKVTWQPKKYKNKKMNKKKEKKLGDDLTEAVKSLGSHYFFPPPPPTGLLNLSCDFARG